MNPREVQWCLMSPGTTVDDLLDELVNRPAWHARAACRGEDVSTFILERGQSDKAAQRVCASCPVRDECAAYAMDDPELVGVWGGTSGRQRRLMRRVHRQAS